MTDFVMKPKKSKPLIAVMMGSKTDWPSMKNASDILSEFDVSHEVKVLSAHRTPEQLINYVKNIEEKGESCKTAPVT